MGAWEGEGIGKVATLLGFRVWMTGYIWSHNRPNLLTSVCVSHQVCVWQVALVQLYYMIAIKT